MQPRFGIQRQLSQLQTHSIFISKRKVIGFILRHHQKPALA